MHNLHIHRYEKLSRNGDRSNDTSVMTGEDGNRRKYRHKLAHRLAHKHIDQESPKGVPGTLKKHRGIVESS